MRPLFAVVAMLSLVTHAEARQLSSDPYPESIRRDGSLSVAWREFAVVPEVDGEAPRMMHMVDEPGTRRLFVSTMRGRLYMLDYDGKTVRPYLDLDDPKWGIGVQFTGSERGFQSFAFHPQFAQRGTPGYGRFYTHADTGNVTPRPDFLAPAAANRTHDTVLLEWTAVDPAAPAYDGGPPRELLRVAQPYGNHNGGEVAFNPLARPSDGDFGLLYVGSADGGSGGDPMNLSQDLGSVFGKILRLDPLGRNSSNGRYGVPPANPFVDGGKAGTLGEIYAYGVRNPQRFAWDAKTGRMLVADIGQNQVEEVSEVSAGANLGWNVWEGSFRYVNRQVDVGSPRSGSGVVWPIVEYDHRDPLFQRQVAVTGVHVTRESSIPPLTDMILFGDNPSGEIFVVSAETPVGSGSASIRRVLLDDRGTARTLLQLIQEKNAAQGRTPATRADLRFGFGAGGQIFLLNKRDGVIRVLVAGRTGSSAAPVPGR